MTNLNELLQGTHEHVTSLEDNPNLAAVDGMLEALAYVIQKISCEVNK